MIKVLELGLNSHEFDGACHIRAPAFGDVTLQTHPAMQSKCAKESLQFPDRTATYIYVCTICVYLYGSSCCICVKSYVLSEAICHS